MLDNERIVADLEKEVKLLKSKLEVIDLWSSIPTEDHTWQQERAAVVAWLRLEPSYQNRPWAVISADIERGEHWPKDKGTL
jgi:hypothetical protein